MGLLQVWEFVKQKQSNAVWVQMLQSNSPHLFLQQVHGGVLGGTDVSEMDMYNVLGAVSYTHLTLPTNREV